MTPRDHLTSIDPDLVVDWLERAAIRCVLGGQKYELALRAAYLETCKRMGVGPLPEKPCLTDASRPS